MRRGSRSRALIAVAALPLLALGGCSDSEDAITEFRIPTPIDITARIDEDTVVVDPSEFGAGLVNITISNQSPDTVQLTIDGPVAAESPPIVAGGVASMKVDFETGLYTVTAGEDAPRKPDEIVVGEERPSSQNDLLKP